MEGRQAAAARHLSPETVVLSYAETARHLAARVQQHLADEGVPCRLDEKLFDPGERVDGVTITSIRDGAALCLVISRHCRDSAWRDREAALALSLARPVLLLLEDLNRGWSGNAVPTLVTCDIARLAAFMARSRPDSFGILAFAKSLLGNRDSLRAFRRAGEKAWRWEREDLAAARETHLEMSLVDDAPSVRVETRLVEARVENDLPVLLLGTTDWKRYKLSFSPDIRAVVPAPAWPDAPVIGFMHADFDSGREWPRAGEAPVELRLLGREVYGWHMSEYYWRAFIGSLPKILGDPSR